MSQHELPGITVVFPFFNQAPVLESILTAWSQTLQKLNRPYEILLIDDGSTDACASLLEGVDGRAGLLKRIPHLQVERHPERRGYGACIRTALEKASQPLFFYTGCDHPYQPADLKSMLHSIEETDPDSGQKVDVVNGYRATTPLPDWRRRLGQCYRVFLRVAIGAVVDPLPGWLGDEAHSFARKMRILFGVRLHDVNSRFKLFRRRIFERFPIQSDGDFVHGEIMAKANFMGCLMQEIPIAQRPGPIPFSPEPVPPSALSKELWTVFQNPKFIAPTNESKSESTLPSTNSKASPESMTWVGEALVAENSDQENLAHIDLLIGPKNGPVGEAFAKALANQSAGHTNLLAVISPNLLAKPATVMVTKVTLKENKQVMQMFGPAQAAVARAVVDSVVGGVIPGEKVEEWVIVCGVFISPSANSNTMIYQNNYSATKQAIENALLGEPKIAEVIAKKQTKHPFE